MEILRPSLIFQILIQFFLSANSLKQLLPVTKSLGFNPSINTDNFRCPLPRTAARRGRLVLENELTQKRVIKLNEINGRKVKIQFFYPNPQSVLKLTRDSAEELSSSEVTTTETDIGTTLVYSSNSDEMTSRDKERIAKVNSEKFDVMCQWQFLAGNASQYLLLTFNKMSAPYSDNCNDAYVSMQKDDGYESRWCGNRRQGNGRPLALFSHSSAIVTVYRKGNTLESPPTGFSVTVESLDNRAQTNNTRNSFRILLRSI